MTASSCSPPSVPVTALQWQPLPLHPGTLPRPRLLQKLCVDRGVIIVHGPPHSGRSTLLAQRHQQLQQEGVTCCWVSLRRHDATDAQWAWTLDQIQQGLSGPSTRPVFVTGLDYLGDDQLDQLLALLTATPGGTLHLSDVRLRGDVLQALQLRGQLIDIDAADLRFDDAEAIQLFAGMLGEDTVCRVNQLAAGWACGLRWLADAPDTIPHCLEHAQRSWLLPRTMRHWCDHTLPRLMPDREYRLLCDLSILGQFPLQLLADLPDWPHAWQQLSECRLAASFVQPSPAHADWLEIPPLLCAGLRRHMLASRPQRTHQLHLFAANWYCRHGYRARTVAHACELGNSHEATSLIEQAGAIAVDLGDGPDRPIDHLLEPDQASRLPLLFLAQTWSQMRTGQWELARQGYGRASHLTGHFTRIDSLTPINDVAAWVCVMDAIFQTAADRPFLPEQLQALQDHHDQHAGADSSLGTSLATMLAFALQESHQTDRSAIVCRDALQQRHPCKVSLFLYLHLAAAELDRQGLAAARQALAPALEVLAHGHAPGDYESVTIGLMDGLQHFESGEMELAVRRLVPALRSARQVFGWVRLLGDAFQAAFRALDATGRSDDIPGLLALGQDLAKERRWPRLSTALDLAATAQALRHKDLAAAQALLQSPGLSALLEGPPQDRRWQDCRFQALLLSLQLSLALGRPRQAAELLPVLQQAATNLRQELDALMAQLQVQMSLRRPVRTADVLHLLLKQARRTGLTGRLQLSGPDLLSAADMAQRSGHALPDPLRDFLLTHAGRLEPANLPLPLPTSRSGQDTLLSPRESDVLALIAQGKTNKEIGLHLGIAEGTVKTHRKGIHEKLGASNRSQAIARARELLLL